MNKFFQRYEKWGFPQEEIKLPKVIRVNTLKITKEDLIKRLTAKKVKLTKIDYLDNGYTFEAAFSASSTPEYLFGYYYIQGAASQLPGQVLLPKPGEIVIDTCAAPGSKTTEIAQYMNNEGMILALDSSHSRLQALVNNIERMGVDNVVVLHKDALYVEDIGIEADAILLDAPCSGNFAIDETWVEKRSFEDFSKKAKLQKQLLEAAWYSLKSGGRILYSTCSLEIEENEEVIEWALDNLPGAELVTIEAKTGATGLTDKTKGCLRMWPAQHKTQGFFMSMLKKQ
jgi:tRNA (cytosine40_48-C5)-methyltransferase